MNGRWWKVASALALVPLVQIHVPQPVQAATLNVIAGDAANLRSQIDAAGDGDIVSIPAGLYELPCGSFEDNNNVAGDLDIVDKSITLRGPTTGTATLRPATGCNERIIDIRDSGLPNEVVIERLTIAGGRPGTTGGGINASTTNATTLTIRDSIISDNRAGDVTAGNAYSGGGVFLHSLGTLVIEDSSITNNSVGRRNDIIGWAAGGGGVAFRGSSSPTGSVTITNTTISDNVGGVSGSFGGGGGLWLDSRDVTLTNVTISDNELPSEPATGNGGGVAISPLVPGPVDVTITGGTISGNTIPGLTDPSSPNLAGGDGGGLYVNAPTGTVSITGTDFDGNEAGDAAGSFEGGSGGNLYVSGFDGGLTTPAAITLTDVTLMNGRAGDSETGTAGSGGGAFLNPRVFGSTVVINNTRVVGNSAGASDAEGNGGNGGGVDVRLMTTGSTGTITINGSEFDDNSAGRGGDGVSGGLGGLGGGAYLAVSGTDGPAVHVGINDSEFADNHSGDGGDGTSQAGRGGDGAGLAVFAQRTALQGTDFHRNTTGDGGSAPIGARGGDGGAASIDGDDITVTGGTVNGNGTGDGGDGTSTFGGVGGSGGGLHLDLDGELTITGGEAVFNATGNGGHAGNASGSVRGGRGGLGGAIHVDHGPGPGTISISGVDITSNGTGNGGDGGTAADSAGGPGGSGGGLAIQGTALDIDISDSTFDDGETGNGGSGPQAVSASGGDGGGIFVFATGSTATLDVSETELVGNTTGNGGAATGAGSTAWPGGSGGGISARVGDIGAGAGNAGTITIDRSSITGNRTGAGAAGGPGGNPSDGGAGGGAWLRGGDGAGGSVAVLNTTIAENTTGNDPTGSNSSGDGGGLHVDETTSLTVTASTIVDNNGASGDALLTTATATLTANVLGPAPDTGNIETCQIALGGTVNSGGHNVQLRDDTCGLNGNTDATDIDGEVLGPLQDNGGVGLSRQPLLLNSASPLVDRIPTTSCSTAIDQLGTTRPIGAGCDVGAVEVALSAITAVDDVIRVGFGITTLDFLANDDRAGFTPDDIFVTITSPTSDGLFQEDGEWKFRSSQGNGAFTSFTYRACLGTTTTFCDEATVTLIPDVTSQFVSLPPSRIFDTRPGQPAPGPKGFVSADSTINVQITGVAGIPSSGVTAVAMNVTSTATDGNGFITVFPTGTPRPNASNLNVAGPGDTVPNFVVVPVGTGGRVSIYTLPGTHLLADVAGYFTGDGVSTDAGAPGSDIGRLIPLAPQRVFDTRPGQPAPGPKGFVSPESTIEVQIAGRAGVPAAGATAVVMNLTAAASSGRGFVTAFPSGTTRPIASNLNMTGPGQTVPNLVIVPIGANGRISLYTNTGVHLLGDVTGYITDASAPTSLSGLFVPNNPQRAFDTRPDQSPPGNKGFVNDGDTISIRFTANASTPATGAGAVMMNATAARAAAPGFVTAWPDGQPLPVASTLNLTFVGQVRPNAAILPIGTGGRINFFTFGGVHLLADVFGWFLE